MAIVTAFSPIRPQDVSLIPVHVLKDYSISNADVQTTSSGFFLREGLYSGYRTPIGAPQADNDPVNSVDGTFKHVIWRSIYHLYYRNAYDPGKSFEHNNPRYCYKFLNISASVLSIPYFQYGEHIRPGSFSITSSLGFKLEEDRNGNIYDPRVDSSSFAYKYNLVGYWGFNDLFVKLKNKYGTFQKSRNQFQSYAYNPERGSLYKNVFLRPGVKINNTSSGMSANFTGDSCIVTENHKYLNFDSEEDFSISFWIKSPVSQSKTSDIKNSIISKRGSLFKTFYGKLKKRNANDLLVETEYYSSSLVDSSTDNYPYHFEIYNDKAPKADSGKVLFSRSDGINTVTLVSSQSLCDGDYHHVCVVKEDKNLRLYVDGTLNQSKTDNCFNPINDHSLIFGSENISYDKGFSGSLDEIRIYRYAVPTGSILSLADNSTSGSLYQTSVVGNVFYRRGNVVISSLNPIYQDVFKRGNWNCNYKGSHTIYQYEVLCRAKKGSFNLTMNPTARRHPNSDLYRNEITGSLLMPYATSIGIYTENNELVATAKLSQPVQMRGDVDINFLLRWDV